MEFIGAARMIREEIAGKAVFLLAGDCDKGNLAVLKEADLLPLLDPGYIEWIGFRKDMYAVYRGSDIVVLPSYREGLPKSLIEACAVGRAVITTDVPGCRECVREGWNGFLVPAKDFRMLAKAILELVRNGGLRKEFGRHSRLLAEQQFSLKIVVEKHMKIYSGLVASNE